jgi:AraC-like DNA-binding protein
VIIQTRENLQTALLAAIAQRAPQEGRNPSPWPGLSIFRATRPSVRFPVVYEPCLCFVAQGSKRLILGDEEYVYDQSQFLVLALPLPAEAEIFQASPEEPFLSLALQIDAAALSDLLLAMAEEPQEARHEPAHRAVCVSRMHDALAGAIGRLLDALDDPMDRRILAPLALREILYHALSGEQGSLLRSIALDDSRSHRIAHVLRYLRAHYGEPLDIATIARAARMSPSTLHHTFKEVTSVSPLQYLKQIRLHHARLLLLNDGLNSGEAAHRVGYGSPSQFSREFKRLFGVPPTYAVERLRE